MPEPRREFTVGEQADETHVLTDEIIAAYASVSGDRNPIHLDEDYAKESFFEGRIAHGMLIAGFISSVLGNALPGPGAIYRSQTLKFLAPARPGDTITARVTVTEWEPTTGRISLRTEAVSQTGTVVLTGDAHLVMVWAIRKRER